MLIAPSRQPEASLPTLRTPIRIRWWIFWYLFLLAILAFIQRTSLSIAAERMMPELHLSQMKVGWLMETYTVVYTALQIPAGVLGERIGARAILVATGALSLVATIATPLAPVLLSGAVLFVALVLAQTVLGAAHAPVFPVMMGVFEAWFPRNRWAVINGVNSSGVDLGTALAPPLIVTLTIAFGWQNALLWISLPTIVLTALWGWYGRNRPREHPSVTAAELAELGEMADEPKLPLTFARLLNVLTNRDVLLLSVSYLCFNYAFFLLTNWSFLYLIQERHLSALQGGWLAIIPPCGAAVGAWLGGKVSDVLATRHGARWGYRLVPLVTLPLVGLLLLLAIGAGSAPLAVGLLTLAFAGVEANEGAYWAATMSVARADTMAAGGVLNTGGNLGGVIGIPIVAWFTAHGDWYAAFATGSTLAIVAALLWLLIDADRRLAMNRRAL
jgi:ACS family glucarate transporter-like MFS transporter